MAGCSAQYDENSTSDFADKMNGGAVKDDKSPENEAKDFKDVSRTEYPTVRHYDAGLYLQERCP